MSWTELLAIALAEAGDDVPADDETADDDDAGEPFGARARALHRMAVKWPHHPDFPALAGKLACDPDDEVREVACWVVEGFAEDPQLDGSAVRAVASAAGQDDDGTGTHELVDLLVDRWGGDPAQFPAMAALVEPVESEPVGVASAAAVRALADGWRDDHRTRPLLERTLAAHATPAARYAALEVLVAGWADDPAVGTAVIASGHCDPDPGVRAEAVRSVRLRWPDRPDALDLLLEVTTHDSSPNARQEALHALGSGHRAATSSHAVLTALLQAAQDDDPQVRTTARDALYTWPEQGAVDADWLHSLATRDPDDVPRAAAVRAAVRHGGTGDQALARITDILQGDDPDARVAALRGLAHLDREAVENLTDQLRRTAESDPWFRARQVAAQLLATRPA